MNTINKIINLFKNNYLVYIIVVLNPIIIKFYVLYYKNCNYNINYN